MNEKSAKTFSCAAKISRYSCRAILGSQCTQEDWRLQSSAEGTRLAMIN